jgi:hypothetical protein
MLHRQHGSVALCLTVKDHHWDIVEWLDWHLAIGVDKIYVFDMGSAGQHDPGLQGRLRSLRFCRGPSRSSMP